MEREAVEKLQQQRRLKLADKFLDKQLVLANGQQFLYKIEKEWVKTGTSKSGKENGFWRSKKPKLVENEEQIRDYLESLVDEANGDMDDDQDPGATYYFITTKEPHGPTLEALMNRTFGSVVQSTKLVDDTGKSLPITQINIVPIAPNK